jgi:hypothetical protein
MRAGALLLRCVRDAPVCALLLLLLLLLAFLFGLPATRVFWCCALLAEDHTSFAQW